MYCALLRIVDINAVVSNQFEQIWLDFDLEQVSENEQWQTWSRKAPSFGYATFGWASCIIDSFRPHV